MGVKQIRDGNWVAANLMIQGEYYVWLRISSLNPRHLETENKSWKFWWVQEDMGSLKVWRLKHSLFHAVSLGSEENSFRLNDLWIKPQTQFWSDQKKRWTGEGSHAGLTLAVALAWYSGQPFTVIVSCMYWYTWKHEERRLLQRCYTLLKTPESQLKHFISIFK